VLPRAFHQTVVKRQRHDIETEVGRALHVAMAAENIGAVSEVADVAGCQQQNAAGANIGGADGELSLPHRPDQRRGLLLGEHLGDALDLRLRQTGHALDLIGCPFLDFLADIVHAVDALLDELLVLPAVLENVPEHSVDRRDVGARSHAHIFRRMSAGARQAWIDRDEVGAVELLAFEQMLQ
jgi:hypothetical protein